MTFGKTGSIEKQQSSVIHFLGLEFLYHYHYFIPMQATST